MCLSSISSRPPSYRVAFEIETRERESVIKWLAHSQLYLSGTCHTLPHHAGCRSRCDAISPIRQAGQRDRESEERRDINVLLSRTTNLPYLSIVLKECERTVCRDPVAAVTRDDTTRRRRRMRSLLRRTTGRGTMKSYFRQT